ncbi:CRISPR-associated endonuclease Cas3'' [Desulfosarcina sp. OttesenSCG-928-A07]|nr:CRISPR-associated endonuclease Cas3'' [Desulfosarcina sp. OttesenSCG-928-G17]MDL2329586.1 CRISPR-associated endonuclease Cas3'' [Desulfosarcina sp. OttesenSCG-928-A07]
MMEYLARSASRVSPSQSYFQHIFHVLVRGRCYLRKALYYAQGLDIPVLLRIVELALEYHDLGKLDDANQNVLKGIEQAAHLPLSHADAGVAFLMQQEALLAALLVYAHHAGLPDYVELEIKGMRNQREYNNKGMTVEQWVDKTLSELLKRHDATVRPRIRQKNSYDLKNEIKAADVRILFSCLTHADHGDAARASGETPWKKTCPKLNANKRLDALQGYVRSLAVEGKISDRDQLRAAFFDACLSSDISEASPVTICDAPVGTGKTTAVMAYLLGQAAQHKLRRIFIILPFTNIITQSVKIYRMALVLPGEKPEDVVAEIHHRADFQDKNSRKLTALWDAPIIVTTAVAFFETLASATPSTLRRLQNLPGSAVFLDEAHAMLPVKLLPLAWQWIQHAALTWSCRWVLASGSLCHFWELDEFKLENNSSRIESIHNILPREQQLSLKNFESSRVQYRYQPEPMTLCELAEWLGGLEGPLIVVLNTVHTAAAAAKAAEQVFGEGNVLHLSTALTAKDREIVLNLVDARLAYKGHTKWCLIATACVEAGVDFSFRTGVREGASLLSLLQLSGRVNRNGEADEADVWTISLNGNDNGVTINPAFKTSSRILRDLFEKGFETSPDLCTDAMQKEIREQGDIPKTLYNDEMIYSFKTVEKDFKVIDDDSYLAVVDEKLIKKIRSYEDISWQDIQRHSVRVRRKICQNLSIEESKRYPGVFLWDREYSPFLGYMEAVLKLEKIDVDGYYAYF